MLEAILIGGSRMSPKVAILKPLSSAVAIGSGGPFGAEGPIIMSGGVCGSIFAQIFHLTSAERKTLLVAGAAGGMAATFGTPLAAMLLAVEVMLFEWKPRSLIPVTIAAGLAAMLRPYFFGADSMPMMQHIPQHAFVPSWSLLLSTIVVGLSVGVLSLILTWGIYAAEYAFHRFSDPLDVVAGDRRAGGRHRRILPANGPRRRLRPWCFSSCTANCR